MSVTRSVLSQAGAWGTAAVCAFEVAQECSNGRFYWAVAWAGLFGANFAVATLWHLEKRGEEP